MKWLVVKMRGEEVVRESLLHVDPDVVVIAADAVVEQGTAAAKDTDAVPYLIYSLAKRNYPVDGSEAAALHSIMKIKLIEAIRATAGLDIEVSKIDENDPEQVNQVLSEAKAWAKRKGISLFKE